MGGGIESFEEDIQVTKILEDLDVVNFAVSYPETGNLLSLNGGRSLGLVSREISAYLKENNFKFKEMFLGEKGGGGMDTFLAILKDFLQFRSVLILVSSLFTLLKSKYIDYIATGSKDLTPKVSLHFKLESQGDTDKIRDKHLIQYTVSRKLGALLLVTRSIVKLLKEKHEYMDYDVSVSIEVPSMRFSTVFLMPLEFQKPTAYLRFLNIIKWMVIKENRYTTYTFTWWKAIKRSEIILSSNKDKKVQEKLKKYYLFFSANLIKDFF